jgi:hypothetical protein
MRVPMDGMDGTIESVKKNAWLLPLRIALRLRWHFS